MARKRKEKPIGRQAAAAYPEARKKVLLSSKVSALLAAYLQNPTKTFEKQETQLGKGFNSTADLDSDQIPSTASA